jgi:hypothetical protein
VVSAKGIDMDEAKVKVVQKEGHWQQMGLQDKA